MTNINDILLEGARRLMPHAIDEHRSVAEAAVTIAAMIAHANPSVLVRDDGTASLVVDIGGAEVIVVAVSVSDGTVWAAYVGDVRISWSQSDPSSWPQHAAAAGLSVDKCRWTVKTLSNSTPWLPEEFAAALSKSLDPDNVVFAGQRDGVRDAQAMGRDELRDLLTKQTRALMPEFTGDVDDLRAEDIVAAWERSVADGTTETPKHKRVTPAPLGPLRTWSDPAPDAGPSVVDRAEPEPLIFPSPQRLLAECMSNSLSNGRFGDFEKAVAYAERLVKLAEDGFFEVAQADVYRLHRGEPRFAFTPPRDDGGKGGAA